MQIKVERFLAFTALLATTGLVSAGCASEDTAAKPDAGTSGSGGTGATGGSGGTAGSSGSAGTGGSAGSTGGAAGAGGSAGSGDAGTECLGDDATSDAGVEGICLGLSYYGTVCGDAGVEGGLAPLGVELCDHMEAYGRAGVTEEMFNCLNQISGDACAQAHDDAVSQCILTVFPMACENGAANVNGTVVSCADIVATCTAENPSDPNLITETECQSAFNAHTETSKASIAQCHNDATGTNCSDDFRDCVFNFTP